MSKKTNIPFNRILAEHLENQIQKYQYYERMPENEDGYYTINPEDYIKMADGIIPMVKEYMKTPAQIQLAIAIAIQEYNLEHGFNDEKINDKVRELRNLKTQ